eukprot:m.68309 g.68309  ORF g.68309 m.68309 type:complete len:981 (+) comp35504_c0_seq10:3-2945(+)
MSALVSSDSEMEDDQNVFLPEIEAPRKRSGRRSPFSCIPLTILIFSVVSASLLIAVIVLAVQKQNSPSQTPPTTESPTSALPAPSSTPKPTSKRSKIWDNIRLPGDIVPKAYFIGLRPNLTSGIVSGDVSIECDVIKTTQNVLIHGLELNITNPRIFSSSGEVVDINDHFYVKETQFWVMTLGKPLPAKTTVNIKLEWTGQLAGGLAGFYKSSYNDSKGKEHVMATTQMEPTDARRAFPCFDEPAMKAHFNISIEYDTSQYTAISNMPPWWNETVAGGSLVRAHFMQTPRMSTYLVAFIVSDFHFVETMTSSGVLVRVWARPELIQQTKWALHCGSTILSFYETFFNVSYPLPKQDLVAIPDFSAGAMENWGLITYREVDLLYDPHTSATVNKQRVAVVIAHELAHQWFGNLVTMKWWNNLWLNEGFASYVEYIGTDAVAPDWDMIGHFFTDTTLRAYSVDSLVTSHPIDISVDTPAEINGVFDSISYDKGASILQMLLNFVGKQYFLKGLTLYLRTHQFGNAETSDLLEALDEVTKGQLPESLTVQSVMSTWTKQSGFPIVNVNGDFKKGTLSLTQQRFVYASANASALPPSQFEYKWSIPITFYSDVTSVTNLVWLTTTSREYQVGHSFKWVKLNMNQTSYYTVNYTESMWMALSNQLQTDHTVFSPRDRAGLLADAFNLARGGLLDITTALEMTKYLHNEKDYVPWDAVLSGLSYIRDMLALRPSYGKFKTFLCEKLAPMAANFLQNGIPDSHNDKLLRVSVISSSWSADCSLGNGTSVFQKVSEHFSLFKAGNASVDPDLHSSVYGAGVAAGDEEEWDFVWNILQTTDVASERRACFSALAQTRKPWLLNRYLEYSVDPSKIRPQDTDFVMIYVSRNVIGRSFAWNFLRSNWDLLFSRYGGGSFSFSYFVRAGAGFFNTEFQLKEFNDFFNGRDAGSANRAVKQTVEKIESNIRWMKVNEKTVEQWLAKNTRRYII